MFRKKDYCHVCGHSIASVAEMIKKGILFAAVIIVLGTVCYADEYVLVMSKDNDACLHMLRIFNVDLKKAGFIEFDRHEEFTTIKWETKRRYSVTKGGERNYDDPATRENVLMSVFDINNDGRKEVVLKFYQRGLHGIASDHIFVLRKEDSVLFDQGVGSYKEFYKRAIKILGGAQDNEAFQANTYPLKEIPHVDIMPSLGTEKNVQVDYSMGGWFYLNPFVYKNVHYLTMTDRELGDPARWLVIFKLGHDNLIKDTCYYLRAVKCRDNPKGGQR